MSYIGQLIEIKVDRDIDHVLELRAGAAIRLDKLEDGVRSQTLTNLRRGWASSLSGKAYSTFQILAAVFDFPVFCVGRSDTCLLSIRQDTSIDNLATDLKNMWRMCNPQQAERVEYFWKYQLRPSEGHRPGWTQYTCPRPSTLNMQALCHLMHVSSPFDLVPKEHTIKAMMAIEQGQTIDISPYLRKSS